MAVFQFENSDIEGDFHVADSDQTKGDTYAHNI